MLNSGSSEAECSLPISFQHQPLLKLHLHAETGIFILSSVLKVISALTSGCYLMLSWITCFSFHEGLFIIDLICTLSPLIPPAIKNGKPAPPISLSLSTSLTTKWGT